MNREIKQAAEHPLAWTGERIIPEPGRYMFRRHRQAYQFALEYCRDKTVLDAGCGEGYGSCLLAEAAAAVTGVDRSDEAIRHAREKYVRPNLGYQVMDVAALACADSAFDVVVSLQVIEHLANAAVFLKEIRRVLKKDGRAIISTPNTARYPARPPGQFHTREYSWREFMDLLNAHFAEVTYYGIGLKGKNDTLKLRLIEALPKLDMFGIRQLFSARFLTRIQAVLERQVALELGEHNLPDALDIIGVCENK